ncbi:MAG: hypothetical protein IJA78_01575 [Clostridia bacterium]|nr:hypothetical protein [Clostridia bacterium]
MQKPRVADKILLSLVAGLLVLGGVSLALFPAPRYSETENRYLAAFPTVDRAALTEGTLGASLDTYCTERLPLRGTLRSARALYHLALGEREVHGVIRARDGSLIRRMTVNETAYTQNLTALTRLAREAEAAELPFTVAVAPQRIDVRADLLPGLYRMTREQTVWQQLNAAYPEAVTFLDAKSEDYWFRTDHHWTADGAFFAYEQLGAALGYTPLSKSEFARVTVSEAFWGTSDAAAGIPRTAPDVLTLLTRADDGGFHAVADGKPLPFAGFYDESKLNMRDKYAVFLGGNYGMLKIEQGEDDTRPALLLLKDSFANSVIPFLARHYRIVAVDTRYYRGDLTLLAAECDAVLALYGMQTLTESALFSRAHLAP